ncbi:hypothetical protein [Alkalimonas amylolytica]|uniref:Uncharacterized protein n=1 Tax=Alkalimonas amylolytica TaxID=152573 RepID=A0A1H4G6C0_ALKAM|nr:hypothetical protein [Alkalimonas amylolytica]SEB05104.1 hypothetical protein SAMN04488051_1232 [Alkalimonas amylolytica]
MKLSQKHTKRSTLSGLSLAHSIKEKMGQDYHGLLPPHFVLGLVALLSAMTAGFLLVTLFSFTFLEFSFALVIADAVFILVLLTLLSRLIQGKASVVSIKLAQLYSVLCILLGCVWLLLSQQSVHPSLLTALAISAIVAAAIAAFLFSTKGFKKMVCYQHRVLRVKQELLKERTKSG